MKKNKPTPEHWEIDLIKYRNWYTCKLKIGDQSFCIQDADTKPEATWVKKMLTIALRNLIYGELQRYEIWKKINNDFEGETVESIIEKYLK
jgi:hypothetical protein